jgi:hypothetical protein
VSSGTLLWSAWRTSRRPGLEIVPPPAADSIESAQAGGSKVKSKQNKTNRDCNIYTAWLSSVLPRNTYETKSLNWKSRKINKMWLSANIDPFEIWDHSCSTMWEATQNPKSMLW